MRLSKDNVFTKSDRTEKFRLAERKKARVKNIPLRADSTKVPYNIYNI